MVEMAKGLVWLVAFINVKPIRCRQLDGIGNGTLVALLLEEYSLICLSSSAFVPPPPLFY